MDDARATGKMPKLEATSVVFVVDDAECFVEVLLARATLIRSGSKVKLTVESGEDDEEVTAA